MAKLTLDLSIEERDTLFKLAEREKRNPRAQAALLIRGELERRGLLPGNNAPTPRVALQLEERDYATF